MQLPISYMGHGLLCECGEIQSIKHIVEAYPSTKYEKVLTILATVKWLEELHL